VHGRDLVFLCSWLNSRDAFGNWYPTLKSTTAVSHLLICLLCHYWCATGRSS
jgi:hypothetical protein